MSSVDPRPPADRPDYPRPTRLLRVLAALMSLVLLVGVGSLFGVAWAIPRMLAAAEFTPETTTRDSPPPDEGQPGVGDPYFPTYGSSGYDALKYTITASWEPRRSTLTATTVISARATQPLASFYFDLALPVSRVVVNGAVADFSKSGFQDVKVTPREAIRAGTDFQVSVDYAGSPGELKQDDTLPFYSSNQEWTFAGEPESSAWWFPADDHPSDPALMDLSVRVPAGMEAVSVGRLASRDTGNDADFDTWHWVTEQPLATYLAVLSIGQYVLQEGTVDGRPYVYAVSEGLPSGDRDKAFAALQTSGAVVRTLESMFGPYPFSELGGIVPANKLPFAGLESQTRPIYDRSAILSGRSTNLIVHELAHMWFGDNVTVARWDDIFQNEAYASWAEWGYAERTGGRPANERLNSLYEQTKGRPDFWRVTMIDPTRAHLFDTVYVRGPMALQALRNVMGDAAFLALARDWGQQRGSRSLEQWMVEAQSRTRVDLVPFFDAWIYSPTVPARTEANGFRG